MRGRLSWATGGPLSCPSGHRGRMRFAHSIMVCVCVFPSQAFPREEWRRKLELERKRSLWQEREKNDSVEAVAWVESVFSAGFSPDPSLPRI